MPLYDYRCKQCNGEYELFTTLSKWNLPVPCPDCGGEGERIITMGHGGSHDDHPAWLDNSVRMMIQDLDDPKTKPIETRQELTKYLKDNGIVAKC